MHSHFKLVLVSLNFHRLLLLLTGLRRGRQVGRSNKCSRGIFLRVLPYTFLFVQNLIPHRKVFFFKPSLMMTILTALENLIRLSAKDFEFEPAESEHAANALVRLSKEHSMDLICLGPLTNVAIALKLDPAFLSRLHSFTIMGKLVRVRCHEVGV